MRWLRVDDLYSLIPLIGETTTQIAVELWDYVWLITLNRPAKKYIGHTSQVRKAQRNHRYPWSDNDFSADLGRS